LAVQKPQGSSDQQKFSEMRAYIKELESTMKNMHDDIKTSYSADNMKDIISNIMKEHLQSS
jgi:hypothetical protein